MNKEETCNSYIFTKEFDEAMSGVGEEDYSKTKETLQRASNHSLTILLEKDKINVKAI